MTGPKDIESLPPLREVIEHHGLRAHRALGQNFLLDLNLTDRIAKAASLSAGDHVIEVGPGPGGLTRALLKQGVPVYAIEKDSRCIDALSSLKDCAGSDLTILEQDALKVNYETICPAPRKIVANLPYNISTVLLLNWLKTLPLFQSMTLMFQKEVADRLTAQPNTKAYGRLSVMTQWLCTVEHVFDINPKAFVPAPKVTSTVVHLVPKASPPSIAFATMERVTQAAFGQRRKMLRASLKPLGIIDKLTDIGIAPTDRAEDLSVEDFCRLATLIEGINSHE